MQRGGAEDDFNNYEKSDNNFIAREKGRLGILKNDPKIESEILATKEKYKLEKKKLKSSFLSRLKKIIKYATGGAIALAFTAHFAQKEYPDYLSKEKEPKKIEWNESTEKEIGKLAHEYALLIKEDSVFSEIPDSVFENHFTQFVIDYGPDIEVVHPGDDMSIGNKISEYVFQNILNQPDHRAHYKGGTLFYEEKNMKMNEDSTEYDIETTSLVDFVAEFSHHINRDWEMQRSFAYTEDLVRKGFQQQQMYEDPYSSEYQAHSVTQNSIAKYLFPDSKKLNVNFVNLYNTQHEYYREFMKMRGYEKIEDIEELDFNLLMNKKSDDIAKDKHIVFQNLENIRNSIDKIGSGLGKKIKSELFGIIIENFPLEKSNLNFEKIASNAKELIEIKNKSLNNENSFLNLTKELEEKFKNDSEYNYVSMTESVFDESMVKKIDSLRGNDAQIEYAMKLYKLYVYGTLKAIEGNAFGYSNGYKLDNFGENRFSTGFGKVRNAISSYCEYLNNTKESLTRSGETHSEKIQNFIENYKIGVKEPLSYFWYSLEQYIENNKTELDSEIKDFSHNLPKALNSWEYETLLKLQKGLNENHSPDLKRDFLENNNSPLSKILE